MNIHQKNDSDEMPGLPKSNQIIYLPELPTADEFRPSEGARVAVPTGEDEYNVYVWHRVRWVYSFTCYRRYPAASALDSACLYLGKVLNRLEQAAAVLDVGDEDLLLKLAKITKDVARAKHELAFDVIMPLGKTRDEKKKE